MLQLKIVKTTTADVVRAYLRCRQDLAQALGETLDILGILAVAAKDLARIPDANIAFAPEELTAGQIGVTDAAFANEGSRCLRWVSPMPNPMLRDRGYAERLLNVMRLTHWQPFAESPAVMVIQARAAIHPLQHFMASRFNEDAAYAIAIERHLDEPKMELLLAMENVRAIACAGLLTSGDAAMLCSRHALSTYCETSVERLLADRLIEFAARATLRHITVAVDEKDAAAIKFYAGLGFERAGMVVEYDLA